MNKDVLAAGKWLCDAFGFTMRIDMGSHGAQLNVGDGAVVLMEPPEDYKGDRAHVMARVEDVYSHCEHAQQRGARVMRPPADYPYGERQYTVEDFAGHVWTFSQSIADMAPESWGGTSGQL